MTTRCVKKNSENIDGTPLALRKKISQDSEKLPSNPLTTFYPLEKLVFIYLFIYLFKLRVHLVLLITS